jgi:hypothetical protein
MIDHKKGVDGPKIHIESPKPQTLVLLIKDTKTFSPKTLYNQQPIREAL